MGIKSKKSFTLIELIVAVGIVGLVLPSVFNIFFTIIRQQLILVAYQEMKIQGDSVQRNIKNMLQNRIAYISTGDYSSVDNCPVVNETTPIPTYAPDLYMKDRNGISVHYFSLPNPTPVASTSYTIASDSGGLKTYYLTSKDVSVSEVGFACYHNNDFTPAVVLTKFTVLKSTQFRNISLPYSFKVRLRDY